MDKYIYLLTSLLALGNGKNFARRVLGFFHPKEPISKPCHRGKILQFISTQLPKRGILRKDEQGMVYVNIHNNYIHKLAQFIKDQGFESPPYFGEGKHGAHITVMTPEEVLYYAVGEIKECGQPIKFEPKSCKIVHPETWAPGQQAYLITVKAPKLQKIREKYKIPKNRHAFHITIGVRDFC
jgi:hypothetical protein